MLKFLRTFALAAAMMLPFAMQAQQSWTVADGTTTHALVPLDFYNCDGSGNRQAQMLYPASLLTEMDGATIGTVKLYHQNTGSKTVTASTWYLRMGETSEADLSSGFSSETLTTVYSGNLVITGGVMTFELTTPYTYNGGNLIVEIQTSGATGNWFGSSSQGCYGVDNAGSTYSTMSSPNYTAFVPKATFTEVPNCFPVTNLAIDATQTTNSSLTLTWADALNTGASYDVYLVTPTDTTPLDNTTTTSYTATGLDANTAYVFGVVSNCGGDDMAQMVTVSGRTACAAIATLPYTMGFEDADLQGTTSALLFPFCWTRINTSTSTSYNYYPYAYSSTSAHNGGRHLYFYASSYGSYADTTGFVMPELDVTTYPMNGNRVTFWAKASSSSYPFTVLVGTMTDPTDRSTFTLAESVSVTATSYTKYTVSLASATATDAYVAFIVPKVGSSMYIDDVTLEELPSCGDIASVQIASTSTESITLSWTAAAGANGYTIYDMADNRVIGTTADTTYTVDNLEPNTAYTLGVQSNCAGGDGLIATISGRTACLANTDFPWSENFDAIATSTATTLDIPCWTNEHISGSGAYFFELYTTNNGTNATGQCRLRDMSNGTMTKLTLPLMDIPEGSTYQFSIDVYRNASGTSYTSEGVRVFASTDGNIEGATELGFLYRNYTQTDGNVVAAEAASGWYTYDFIIPFTGEGYIILRGESQYGSSTYLDNFVIDEAPSCIAVTNLAVSNVTSESVTLTWADAVNSGATYSVYTVTPTDTTPVESGISGTTYTVENLTPNTPYVFGVAADCGSDQAEMVIVSTRTACTAIAIDSENNYTENFDSYTVSVSSSSAPSNYPNHEQPACWEFLNMSASSSAYPQAFMTSYSSYAVSGNCLFFKSSSSTPLYAILPDFEATGALQLLFSYRNEGTSASNGTILVGVMSDASDATTFVALDSCTRTTTITPVEVNIPAGTLDNGARLAFCYRGGTSQNYYAAIDNVIVREAPACLHVENLVVSDITAHTATLTWEGDADGYTIYNMSDTSVYQYANDTTIELYALSGETAYTFGVTSNCGSDESEIVTISFTTLISCPAPTGLAASLTPGDGTVATLNWHEAGEASEWQLCLNGDMTNLVTVYDTTYDMTNLTPEQAITAKVRAICGADDTSAWSAEISFTPTNAYTLTVNNGTATNSKVPVYGNWVDNHIKSQFIIPAADLSAMAYGNITKLTFYSSDANKSWGAASFEVYMTETSETTVNSLAAVSDMTQVYTGSLGIANNVMEITLTTPYQYMGGNLMIAFEQPTSGTYSNCTWYGVDATGASQGGYGSSVSQQNFLPRTTFEFTPGEEPSCLPVSNLAVSDITTDGATLSWTGDASSYNVYVISGSDTTIAQNVSNVTVTLTGLTPMTQYTYGVRSACGGDESDIRVVTFSTACAAVTLPYTETFASTSATRNCWNLVSNNTANVGGDYGMGFVTVSGRDVMRFSSYTYASDYNQYGFSPLMNVSTDATNLQVKVVYGTYGTTDQLFFGYITATDTVWDPTPYTTSGGSSASDWQSQTFVIPATATQLAVHYYGNFQYYAWVDSVVVTELTGDYCFPVAGLAVDTATANSVTISWTGDAASYDVYNGTALVGSTTDTFYTVSGLTASTAYTFGVQAICSATDSADMVTIAAMTDCEGGSCTITIVGTDEYGDGWDNSYIDIQQNGASIAHNTVEGDPWAEGDYPVTETYTYTVCAGVPVTFTWVNGGGNYDYEASFVIKNGNDSVLYTASDASELTAGSVFYTANNVCGSDEPQPQPQVEEATIAASAVTYWVGTGNNQVVMAVNWADTALAWGVNFSTDSITSQAALDTIVANDPRFSWTTGSYGLGNITFTENGTTHTGDANHFWESKRNTISDMGLYQNLGNGDFQKWANSAAGVVVDSMEYSGVWYYMYNYPMTIYPVTAPQPGPQPADSIVVTFATNDATLGTTTPAPGTYTYHAGDTIRFSANATTGNSFVEWVIDYGDGTTDTLDAQYTAAAFLASTMIGYGITNMTLTANFQAGVTAPDSIVVTYATNNAALGTTNPAPGTYTYMSGDTIYFNAIPTTGNSFAAWIINYSDGSADTVGSQYQSGYYFLASTMIGYGITSMTMTAYFQEGVPTPDSIEVTYAVNDATMGSITPNGTIMTAVGDSIAATATANAGYELYGWRFTVYVNGAVVSDTTLAIVETSVNFGAVHQFYANANATITITAMFQQQVGIEDADISNVNVYSANSTIYVRGAEGQSVYVFDVNGRMLNHEAKASESCSFHMENTGVYLVKVGNAAAQRVIVVR